MILNENNLEQYLKEFEGQKIRLIDAEGKALTQYNRSKFSKEDVKRIMTKFNSSLLEPGIYFLEIMRSTNVPKEKMQVNKNTDAPKIELAEQPKEIIKEVEKKTVIYSDREIIEILLTNERLTIENENLKNEIDELNAIIEDLENVEPLADAAPKKSTFEYLAEFAKETIPSFLDNYFQMQQEKNEIERAKLGAIAMQQQQIQQQTTPPPVQNEVLTLEQLEAVKKSNPNDFYSWLSMDENRQYYEHLKAQNHA